MLKKKLLLISAGFFLFYSCSDLKKGLGFDKDVPNEFLIEKKEALSLPPDYKILPPDSKTKSTSEKKSEDSLDLIINKNLKKQKTSEKSKQGDSADIEKNVLKQIK